MAKKKPVKKKPAAKKKAAKKKVGKKKAAKKKANVLTKEIAEKYAGGNLESFTTIEDEAAEILSKHNEGWLYLAGLTELSDAAAESLSKTKLELVLTGLTTISDAAAESLSRHKGGELSLGPEPNSGPGKGGRQGITELSDAAAEGYININLGYLIVNPWTPHGASSSAARILEAAGHGEWPADEGFYYEDVR